MVLFWREFSERPKILLKKYDKKVKINLNERIEMMNTEEEDNDDKNFYNLKNFWKEDFQKGNYWKNFYIKRTKKEEYIKTLFLGRIVGIDKNTQYVSISTGIKRDGVYKIAKKVFVEKLDKNFRSETKDEIRFYLPFYNEPHKEALSRRFMKVTLGEISKKERKESIVWKNWRKSLKLSFFDYLNNNKMKKNLIPLNKTLIKINRKRTKFLIFYLSEIIYGKGKNLKLWKEFENVEKGSKRDKKYELLLLQKGENSINWLKKENELYIRCHI